MHVVNISVAVSRGQGFWCLVNTNVAELREGNKGGSLSRYCLPTQPVPLLLAHGALWPSRWPCHKHPCRDGASHVNGSPLRMPVPFLPQKQLRSPQLAALAFVTSEADVCLSGDSASLNSCFLGPPRPGSSHVVGGTEGGGCYG